MISVLGGCRVTVLSQNWQSFVLGFHRCLKIKMLSQLDFHRVIVWSIGWRKSNEFKINIFIHSKYSSCSEWLRRFCLNDPHNQLALDKFGRCPLQLYDSWHQSQNFGLKQGLLTSRQRDLRKGLRCGNVPVQNNANRFLFQKAKYTSHSTG